MTAQRRFFSNTASETTLSSGVTGAATSITVGNATGYPDDLPFSIRCENEIMLVTAKSGTTFTVERGYDGTTGVAHSISAPVVHVAIAADFNNRFIDPLTIADTNTIYDDEFDQESTVTWAEVTPTGTANWTQKYGVLSSLFYNQDSNDCAAYVTSLNGLSYPLYVVTASRVLVPDEDYAMFGPLFSEGQTTASNMTWNMTHYVSTQPGEFVHSHRSGTFANVSTNHFSVNVNQPSGWLWQRIDWVSTNDFRTWLSVDGISWTSMDQAAQTPSVTPTHYGLGVSAWGGGTPARNAAFQFFRVYTVKPTWWQEA